VTAACLRALVQIAHQRGQLEVEEAALAILRALGLASPQEAAAAPNGLHMPIHHGPPMANPDAERLRCIAHQLREELGHVLSSSDRPYPICQDSEVSEAIRQISLLEDELSAPGLPRLGAKERGGLFTEVAALFLDPEENGSDSPFRDALERSLGRWTRRKLRRIVEETNSSEIEAFDHQAWGEELRAMAAAQLIDRNGGDLRTTLRALLVIESQDPSQCPPEGAEIGTRASASEAARRLLIRMTSMLCERLEQAG
jgi:hypothetical protein